MSRSAPPQQKPQPWWAPHDAEHGHEICAHCGHGFPHTAERRCEECDEPLCPICAAENCHDCDPEEARP